MLHLTWSPVLDTSGSSGFVQQEHTKVASAVWRLGPTGRWGGREAHFTQHNVFKIRPHFVCQHFMPS